MPDPAERVFGFRFTPLYRAAALPFGIRPATAEVRVTGTGLQARFGPWRVRTPLANVVSTTVAGPFGVIKTAGPAHLSFSDRGLTFATNGDRGLCIEFAEPVRGIDPLGLLPLRHPGLTVTVADPDGLAAALQPAARR